MNAVGGRSRVNRIIEGRMMEKLFPLFYPQSFCNPNIRAVENASDKRRDAKNAEKRREGG